MSEPRGPDWRWLAGGALALLGVGGGLILGQHIQIENERHQGQEKRLDALDLQMKQLNEGVSKIPIVEVRLAVMQTTLEKIEKAVADEKASGAKK